MRLFRRSGFNRALIIAFAILLQMFFFFGILRIFQDASSVIYVIYILISIGVVLWIVNKDGNPNYKIAWIIPIMLVPVFGGVFYLAFGTNQMSRREKKRMANIDIITKEMLRPQDQILDQLKINNMDAYRQSKYIQSYGHFPPAQNTEATYLATGELNYAALKHELEKAKHFIFMEYFIINKGKMWSEILNILERKAAEGVDVRLIYDDFGCLTRLPKDYPRILEKKGIKCLVFNPIVPILSTRYNTRNHRKITVIDNQVAFTGGINLADEYINEEERFGHWKDVGIMVKGEATWSFTVMFITMWDYLADTSTDILAFKERYHGKKHKYSKRKLNGSVIHTITKNGIVQPFSDNPLDNEPIGQNVYLNLINKAKHYVFICTPYLIIDDEMTNALTNAAKSGVDVRIMTPHIADKWYVHTVSRTYYVKLIQSGVSIYEYTPGFIHSKTFVVDDLYGVVGTINMDYRSLFLHFECGVFAYRSGIEQDLKKDFLETQEKCMPITEDYFKQFNVVSKFLKLILRLFAPLM